MIDMLITGATSYVGVALTERLNATDHVVHAVVRPTSNVSRLQALDPAPVIHVHDGSTQSMVDIMERAAPRVVYHLAAMYRREHRLEEVKDLIDSNVLLCTQVAESMRHAGVTALGSTSSITRPRRR